MSPVFKLAGFSRSGRIFAVVAVAAGMVLAAGFVFAESTGTLEGAATFTGTCANPNNAVSDNGSRADCEDGETVVAQNFGTVGIPTDAVGISFVVSVNARPSDDNNDDDYAVTISSGAKSGIVSSDVDVTDDGNDQTFSSSASCSTFGQTWTYSDLAGMQVTVTGDPSAAGQTIQVDDIDLEICYVARTITEVDFQNVENQFTASVAPNDAIPTEINVTVSSASPLSSNENDWSSTYWQIGSGGGSTSGCDSTPNETSSGSYVHNFSITAPAIAGTYDLLLRAHNSNNCSGTESDQTFAGVITVVSPDSTPPTVVSVDSDGDVYNVVTASPQAIMVTFDEDISVSPTIAVSGDAQTVTNCADADAKTFCFDYSVPVATDSITKTVQISTAQDAATNVMVADNTHTFVVDTLAPAAPVIDTNPANPANTTAFSFTFHGLEGALTFLCRVVADPFSLCTSPFAGTTAAGSQEFNVKAVDAAGNESGATAYVWTIDLIAPTVLLSTGASEPTNVSPIPVEAQFSEDVTGLTEGDITVVNGSVDSGSLNPVDANTYTFDVTPVADGAVVEITIPTNSGFDSAGNGNDASNTLIRTYDTSQPSVTITGGPAEASYTNDTTPTFTFTMTGGTTLECSEDGGAYGACSGDPTSHTFAVALTDGPHSFSVRASDGVNPDATATRNFNVDTVLPYATITGNTILSGYASSTVNVTVTFSEAVTGFEASDVMLTGGTVIDVPSFTPVSGTVYTFDVDVVPDGAGTVDVPAGVADEANGSGNLNDVSSGSLSFTYDTTAPVITLNGVDPMTLDIGDVYVEEGATALDNIDGALSVTVGGDVVDGNTPGVYVVTYDASDSAGNTSQETRTVTVGTACSDGIDNDGDGLIDTADAGCHLENNSNQAYQPNDTDEFDPPPASDTPQTGGGGGSNGPITGGNPPGTVLGVSITIPGGSGSVLGNSTSTPGTGTIVPSTDMNLPSSCYALITKIPMRVGIANDPEQVKVLQNFLNTELGTTLPLTGFFGPLTRAAVEHFQTKYTADILTPWGLTNPTGVVGVRSQWKINMISCAALNLPAPQVQ